MKLQALSMALAAALMAASPVAALCPEPGAEQIEIYPTANVLPENLLRMYVYFPRPMGWDEGLSSVRLLDEEGEVVPDVFLKSRVDLWSSDRRRLTVLFDPGRVKTGLDANEALGRALIAGQSYTFEVSGSAKDADGCPLGKDVHHTFLANVADGDPPDAARWKLTVPQSKTSQPLIIALGSAHDHLSLAFRLRLVDEAGAGVPGAIALGKGEETWEFTPRDHWKTARYRILIDEALEDLAGNRPGSPFDRPIDAEPVVTKDWLEFTPRP